MKTEFLIVGGGIAGLSAASCLAEQGADVTLIEAGTYPSHKICGEFISPDALPLLEQWEITPATSITTARIVLPNEHYTMELPLKAATLSRYCLEEALAQRARKNGVRIITSARVKNIELPIFRKKELMVSLDSGDRWAAHTLLIGTGRLMSRLTGKTAPTFSYIGVKAHFSGINIPEQLVMHLTPGAYFGMAPVGSNRTNIAGIIACSSQQALNSKALFAAFLQSPKATSLAQMLEKGECLFDDWMTGPVPEFGLRKPPQWPNTFFLGDAAGVIPPATGNGVAMGLTSGVLAAEYALKKDWQGYHSRWKKEYKQRIRNGRLLHRLFLSPIFSKMIPSISRLCPALPHAVYRATRGKL